LQNELVSKKSLECPSCGASAPAAARFCASCGTRLDGGDTRVVPLPPSEPAPAPVSIAHAEPRLFGVVPPMFAFGLACLLTVLAIVTFAVGSWVVGLALVIVAGALFALFVGAARHAPSSPIARATLTAGDRIASWVGFATGSANAWSTAGREVLRLRGELRALRPEREALQYALGDAAYHERDSEVALLRARLRDLDRAIDERMAASAAALEQARRRSRKERLAIRPTEQMSVEEIEKSSPDEKSESGPKVVQAREGDAPGEDIGSGADAASLPGHDRSDEDPA